MAKRIITALAFGLLISPIATGSSSPMN